MIQHLALANSEKIQLAIPLPVCIKEIFWIASPQEVLIYYYYFGFGLEWS